MKAPEFCTRAAALMDDRGKERDKEDGERSMARTVAAFNAMTGHALSEEEGWAFMVYLKLARMQGGSFKLDDYEDCVAYTALMAEAANAAATKPVVQVVHDEFQYLNDDTMSLADCLDVARKMGVDI